MRHPRSIVEAALSLRRGGVSISEIGRQLGVPRRTVTDWVAGRLPQRPPEGPLCETCGGSTHIPGDLPPSYVYLLGLYLGDGSIAAHPRAFKLRITLDAAYPGIVREAFQAMAEVRPQNR
ncbi:MAG: helix-turn-helix domain-containing protein [Actinomycetota bacterium]